MKLDPYQRPPLPTRMPWPAAAIVWGLGALVGWAVFGVIYYIVRLMLEAV